MLTRRKQRLRQPRQGGETAEEVFLVPLQFSAGAPMGRDASRVHHPPDRLEDGRLGWPQAVPHGALQNVLDVEGAELKVLHTLPWDEVRHFFLASDPDPV